MALAPLLVVDAFEVMADDTRRPLGPCDLTDVVIQTMVPFAGATKAMSMPPLVRDLSPALNDEARKIAWDGKLSLPKFSERLDAFIAAAGGLDAMRGLKEHRRLVADAKHALEDARSLLSRATSAEMVDASSFGMVCPVEGFKEYVSDANDAYDAYDGFKWDEYVARHPRPAAMTDDPASTAWHAAYASWVRDNAPPFVFGTEEMHWGGIDPKDVRNDHEERERVDIDALIESGLELHHEDAQDHVVDVKELYGIVSAWSPHAGTGNEQDLALESKLAAWNQKQTIVSYMLTTQKLAAAFPGVTRREVIDWCTANVAKKAAAHDLAAGSWVPAPEPAPSPV